MLFRFTTFLCFAFKYKYVHFCTIQYRYWILPNSIGLLLQSLWHLHETLTMTVYVLDNPQPRMDCVRITPTTRETTLYQLRLREEQNKDSFIATNAFTSTLKFSHGCDLFYNAITYVWFNIMSTYWDTM